MPKAWVNRQFDRTYQWNWHVYTCKNTLKHGETPLSWSEGHIIFVNLLALFWILVGVFGSHAHTTTSQSNSQPLSPMDWSGIGWTCDRKFPQLVEALWSMQDYILCRVMSGEPGMAQPLIVQITVRRGAGSQITSLVVPFTISHSYFCIVAVRTTTVADLPKEIRFLLALILARNSA